MKLEEIRSIAQSKGISDFHMFKNDLIRSIQSKEGNFECFATAQNGECNQLGCLWREDCLSASKTYN